MKAYYSANVSRMPGLCLIDIGDAPYIGYKIMFPKAYFYMFDFSKTTSRWHFILCQNIAWFLSHCVLLNHVDMLSDILV